MRGIFAAVFIVLCLAAAAFVSDVSVERWTSAQGARSVAFRELRPVAVRASFSGSSLAVRSMPPAAPESGNTSGKMGRAEQQARSVANKIPFRKQVEGVSPDAEVNLATITSQPMPAPLISFAGISSNDNAAAYGFRIFPPDTIGDVGPSHYIQAANALFRVFDKQGNAMTPPLKMSALFASLDTVCSQRDDGDPLVLYDQLADRWILSQFCKAFPPFRQMIAVSKTGDPTGEYFVYEFVMPNVKLNDYPKLGIWNDAYYMSTDEFYGSDYAGSGAFAFDREKLLRGEPDAGYIYFDLASPTTMRIGGILPADLDGLNPPPAGSPGLFIGYAATEYGDPEDALRIYEFSADFADPSSSTFSEVAGSPFAAPPFDPTSNPGRDDIGQPPPGEKLDAQSDRLMYRAAYRNFGARESLVVNQTVRVSPSGAPYRAGVRVHELRKPPGGIFGVHESSTLASTEGSRFMGASAQDRGGNIAIGYSVGSNEKPPSIAYTGRLAGDPAGLYRSEGTFVTGTGVQTAFGYRWGDYSGLSVDPSDGCTFWITNEYYSLQSQSESPFGWLTRVGSFRFPECQDALNSSISGIVTNSETAQAVEDATVNFEGGFTRQSGPGGSYGPVTLPPGIYAATVTAEGYSPQVASVDVSSGGTSVMNFELDPTPVLVNSGVELVKESCSLNGAAEPGERVTIDVPLRNTGARDAQELVATLLPFGGVEDPSPSQSYGGLPSGGPAVSRSFSFTVSRGLKCGGELLLKFSLADGNLPVGEVTVRLNAGVKRTAFLENFDDSEGKSLPPGWTTSAEGGQTEWTISSEQADSPRYSAFSPDPRVVGVNELVSPEIPIRSPQAELRFRNWYELETTFLRNRLYDGSVLEISISGGKWTDILDAGGSFVSGGYDYGLIDSCCQNPLAGRRGWSGRSGNNLESEFIDTIVDLPASAAGQNVRFRWRVGTDIGTFRTGQYIDDVEVSDGYSCDCETSAPNRAPFDFDGDGRTDLSVFSASDDPDTPDFWIKRSSDDAEISYFWGSQGDAAVNADYDGDGITDLAVFRPSDNLWFIFRSADSSFNAVQFGLAGDLWVPSDYDGDGKADIAVFRPSEGTWYLLESSGGPFVAWQFGVSGDLPVPGDYDGDGTDDIAVFRPSDGVWYVSGSSDGFSAVQFGISGDRPVPGDYDGDGKSDLAVFRPSDSVWYLQTSGHGFSAVQFGLASDQPLQVDLDGDGKRDVAVFRGSGSEWFGLRSSDGGVFQAGFGVQGGVAVPGIFVR